MKSLMAAVILSLGSCATPTSVYFPHEEWYPSPAPGIQYVKRKPPVIITRVKHEIKSCTAEYHDRESEILSKLKCLQELQ